MAYEIVYTSAQAGLKPGDKGFCIVGASKGIPPQTIKTLEQLSGYRHIHQPGDLKNPVIYAHRQMPTGESVLSRVADAGLDYSGRSNKLVHLLVLRSGEQPSGGPSRTLFHPETMIAKWSGESRHLNDRLIRSDAELKGPCQTWAQITGDAGWAAALAETARNGNNRDAYVLYNEGTDCLRLIDEALSLLPQKDRWLVTFSTFFTKAPGNMNCQWRFIQKGQKEQQEIPPHANIFKLDLTVAMGQAPDSPLTQQARTGERHIVAVKPTSLPKAASEIPPPSVLAGSPATIRATESNSDLLRPIGSNANSPRIQPQFQMPSTGNVDPIPPFEVPTEPIRQFKLKKKSLALPIAIAAFIAGIFGLILGAGGIFLLTQSEITDSTLGNSSTSEDAKQSSNLIEDLENKIKTLKSELSKVQNDLGNAKNQTLADNGTKQSSVEPKTLSDQPKEPSFATESPMPISTATQQTPNPATIQSKEEKAKRPSLFLRVDPGKFSFEADIQQEELKKVSISNVSKSEDLQTLDGNKYTKAGDGIVGKTDLFTLGKKHLRLEKQWSSEESCLLLVDQAKRPKQLLHLGENTISIGSNGSQTQPQTLKLPGLSKQILLEKPKTDITPWQCKYGKDQKQVDDPNILVFEVQSKSIPPTPPKITGTITLTLNAEQGKLTVIPDFSERNAISEIPNLINGKPIPLHMVFQDFKLDGNAYDVRCDSYQIIFSDDKQD